MPETRRADGITRVLVPVLVVLLLAALMTVVPVIPAAAAGTVLFQNSFANRTVDGVGTVTKPTPPSGTNVACLSASGNSGTGPLTSCTSSTSVQGSGKLRLTAATGSQVGGVFGATSFPTVNGLDVTFNSYQYGGGGADGMAFGLAAVDPANPVVPTAMGSGGSALGYASAGGVRGLPNAYLGVGFDVYGNFSSSGLAGGSGCPAVPNIGAQAAGAVVVRGPGNVTTGYCGLTTTYAGTTASRVTLRASTRAASVVPVQVLINPTTASFTSDSGVPVDAGTYKIVITPVGQNSRTLTGPLPSVSSTLYPSTSWLNAAGVPKQLAFGFFGSTGSVTDFHEISDVRVLTFNPVPQLSVSTVAHSAATPVAGAPVTYVVSSSVQSGADVTSPITVTQTVPAGVTPVGGSGPGWVCQPPSGQVVTCATSASRTTNGTALPSITVHGIVTGSITAATIRSSSPTRASSTDANPAVDTDATAGTLPAAPSGLTINPAGGPVAGGGAVTVTLTSSTPPTAVEIGTSAEQQAGTPVTLLPCQNGAVTGCFTTSGNTLTIPAMPARAGPATVGVTVVTLGVATAVPYTYATAPAVPAAPSATAGISGATLTFTAPADNGSPITGYTITPYRAGVAQTPVTVDASTTTRTLTGLTTGSAYTFTVAATNAYGTSAASPASAAVVPYALPAAPGITAVSAGTGQATLSWTAPAANGSAITAYLVTPFIGTVAQPVVTVPAPATTQTLTGLTAGTAYTFTVAAQNAAGTGPPSARSAAVTPNQSPSLPFTGVPAGEVGVAYTQQLTVDNGTSPFTWSISSGTLPAGITLAAATGRLAGTPTASGSFPITVQVTDASGQTAGRAVTLVIAAAPVVTFAPAAGEVGVAYTQQPVLTGGTAPFTWDIAAGSLPAGLTLDPATGAVRGTPTASGSSTVTVRVTDSFAQTASRTATLTIAAQPTLPATPPPAGQVGVAYSTTFTVTGGTAPFAWAVTAGTLPAGLTLNSTNGQLTGTPTTAGTSGFTLTVTDAFSQSASRATTLTVTPGPLVLTTTADVASTVAGATVTWTQTIANTGTTAFTGVQVQTSLAGVLDDAVYLDATATAGTVGYTSPTVSWTGNLAAGATVTVTVTARVNNPDVGDKVLTAVVTSPTLGTNCAAGVGDPRCTSTVTVAGLSIVKTADVSTTTPGSSVRYRIEVRNTGQSAYGTATLTDDLAGVLDDATYLVDGSATSGSLTVTGSTLSWTGAVAVGATTVITYTVRVNDPDTGNRSLTGAVVSPTAGSSCPGGGGAAQCSPVVTVLVPALAISVTTDVATATPGAVVTYRTTLANTGQTAYTGTTVAIALADVLDDAVLTGAFTLTGGSLSYDPVGQRAVWTGDIPVGATVVITGSVTVRNPDPANRTLVATASSSAPGSTCPAGSTRTACTTSVPVLLPALTITQATDSASTTPGSVVRYTVIATNSGQTAYLPASFGTDLTGVLDDARYNADATASTGTVQVDTSSATPGLTWSGNLAVGASSTVTFSVTVADPDTGDRSLTAATRSTSRASNCAAGSNDTRCGVAVPVLLPALSLTLTADAATITPGSVVRYSATITNTGQTTYTGATVALDLQGVFDDASTNYNSAVSTGSLTGRPDGTANWVLDLAPGASATASFSVTVNDPTTGDRSLVAAVSSAAAGSTCAAGSTSTGCRSTVTVLLPGLTFTKTAGATTVTPGDRIDFTVAVTNTGQTAYETASFTDPLAQVLTDAVVSTGPVASTGTVSVTSGGIVWTGALQPGASAVITYSVTVLDPDPGDKLITGTLVSTTPGNNCVAGTADPRCTASVLVLVPGLTIVKTAGSATTVPGATVAHTMRISNSGATPYTGASVTDVLTGALDDARYNTDASSTSGSVQVTGGTLTWTGDLAVGAVATVTYSVTVDAADVGDDHVTTVAGSTARGSNCAPDTTAPATDPRCTTSVPVARLTIVRTQDRTTATPGSVINIPATYTNTGAVPYFGIAVTHPRGDSADDVYPTGDDSATSGTLNRTADAIFWTGDIPVGGAVTVSITRTVRDPDPGNRIATATIFSSAPGSNCPPGGGTDPRCTYRVDILVPELTVSTTADSTAVLTAATVGYTLTVRNSGQTPYIGAVVNQGLAGVLDDAVVVGSPQATTGSAGIDGPTLTWTGDLAVGATAVITYSVTVNRPATGDRVMVATAVSTESGSTCEPASGNPACTTTVRILLRQLTIEHTADARAANLGSPVTYTVTAVNDGQVDYPTAQFTVALADVLDDADLTAGPSATAGAVALSGTTLTWTGPLPVGAQVTVTYTVSTANPARANLTLLSTVSSTSPGSTCGATSTDPRCTATVAVTPRTTLTLTQTTDTEVTAAGKVVTFQDTVANAGTGAVTAEFDDALAGILDDAALTAGPSADVGTVTLSGSTVHWTGTIPAGATVTVTYSVTVRAVPSGDGLLTGALLSSATSPSRNCGTAGSTDPRCAAIVPVASLLVERTWGQPSATPGSTVRAVATFTNTGNAPYQGISISLDGAAIGDDAVRTGDQTASSGSLSLTGTTLTWRGSIPVGGVVTVAGSFVVTKPPTGDRVLGGTWVTAALGSNCAAGSPDTRCTNAIPVVVPELRITAATDVTDVTPGGVVTTTITIDNTGQTSYQGATVLTSLVGVTDDAAYRGDATTTSGAVTVSGAVVTWTGDLAVGQSAVVTYSLAANRPATGDKVVYSTVSSADEGSTCLPGNPSAAGCSTTVTVLTPGLTITATADQPSTVPGAVVTYTLTATNTGQTSYQNARFTAPLSGVLDDATYAGAATATSGTVTVTGTAVSWVGPLAPGAASTVTYAVTVGPPGSGDRRLAQALTSTNQGSTCTLDSSDPRCSTSVPIAGLLISNEAAVSTTLPTGVVRTTVTFTNIGQVPYVDATLTDSFVGSLDDATYNGDATASSGSLIIVPGSGRVVWTGDIPVGVTVTVTGSVTVKNPNPGDQLVTTLVSTAVPGSNCPDSGTDPRCATSVPVLQPGLTITAGVDTTTSTPGSPVSYTVLVVNTGQTAYTGAAVTASLVGVLDDATLVGVAVSDAGAVSVVDGDLTWTGDLAVGAQVIITVGVRINDPDLGDRVLLARASSPALGSSCPPGSTDAGCTATTVVLVPALEIGVVADATTTTPGGTVGYTLTVRNIGQTASPSATVTADLAGVRDDAGVPQDISATVGGVTVGGTTVVGDTVTWTGNLPVGAEALISYRVVVSDPDTGDLALTTAVSSAAPGSTCTPTAPCLSEVTVLLPGLDVSIAADAATTTPGSQVGFTVTVVDTGQTSYLGTTITVPLAGLLDDGTLVDGLSATVGTVQRDGDDLLWTGSLAPEEQVVIGFAVRVLDSVPGDRSLTAAVQAPAAGSSCRAGTVDPRCAVGVAVLVPALTITTTPGAPTTTPGSVVTYTLLIANTGETAYAGAVVSESLAGLLADAGYNDDAAVVGPGTVAYAEPAVTWTGDLAVGASTLVTFSVTVLDPDPGDKTLNTVATSAAPGSSCPPGSATAGCSSLVLVLVPQLTITTSADSDTVVAGRSVRYTLQLANTGQTPYEPATVTDSLAGVLDDADWAGDATATSGTVEYADGTLAWTGALAVGDTATISYSVLTRFPATGDRVLTDGVRSSSPGSSCAASADPGCSVAVGLLVPALSIVKSADTAAAVAGGSVGYTITATNTGEADYPETDLTDDLSGVLDDGQYGGDAASTSGTVVVVDSALRWTGALAVGEQVEITYSVDVPVEVDDGAVLVNRVSSAATGSTCPTGAEGACATSTPIAARFLTLSGLTPSFSVTGTPNSQVAQDGAVVMTVFTNSATGYLVSVRAVSDRLTAATPGNDESIPVGLVNVRGDAQRGEFVPLSEDTPVVVENRIGASSPGGDAVSNDYRVDIPFVTPDTYTGTLEYIVSAP